MEDATASGICPDLPGAASSAVVGSSAIPTASSSTSTTEAGQSILPAGSPTAGDTISATPGNAAAPTASRVSPTGAEGVSAMPTPDGPWPRVPPPLDRLTAATVLINLARR